MNTNTTQKQKVEIRFSARFMGHISLNSKDIHPKEIAHIIDKLNHSHVDEEIERALYNKFQINDLEIEVQIHFSEGSIEWDGILTILNWMAAIGGTVGLIDYLRKIIASVINKVIKKRLPLDLLRHKEIKTTVYIEEEIVPTISLPTIYQQPYMPIQNQIQESYPIKMQTSDESIIKERRLIIWITLFNSALIGALILVIILMLIKVF